MVSETWEKFFSSSIRSDSQEPLLLALVERPMPILGAADNLPMVNVVNGQGYTIFLVLIY